MTLNSERLIIKHLDRIATALEKMNKHKADPGKDARKAVGEILDEAMNGVKEIYEDGNKDS